MKRFCHIVVAAFTTVTLSLNVAKAQKLPVITQPVFRKDTFNIIKFGAVADGITLNTKSINAAIDACNAKGGGVVLIPGGMWLTGPVILKSNVNLHIVRDGLLQFTRDFDQYPLVETNWEGVPAFRNQSPLTANNAVNIAITGTGVIDGFGDAWRMVKKDKLTETQWKKLVESGGILSDNKKTWYPTDKSFKGSTVKNPGVIKTGMTIKDVEAYKDFLRPNLLVFTKCKKVLLEGVTFQNSPAWCLHPLMCEDLTLRNVYAKNPFYAQNGDGIDVESCKNVLIENSTFDVGDDGICMKSGRDEEGRKRAMPTENVIIRNCVVYHAHGGFVIGSEMSGGVRNVFVNNCSFLGTDVGLRFKTARGRGGLVEKIYVSNINMKDIAAEAILFDMYYEAKDPVVLAGEKREPIKVETLPVTDATPQFQDFYVKNIVCYGADKGIFIRGVPEMHVKNVHLDNMVLICNKAIDCEEASNVEMSNITFVTTDTNPLAYILNSDHIIMDKIKYGSADLLLQVQGERSHDIKVTNTDTSRAKQKTDVGFGAKDVIVN